MVTTPRAPLYRRVFVDGAEIRATKADAQREARYYPLKAAYPVEVDGEVRAYLALQRPGHFDHRHKGWVLLSLMPGHRDDGLIRVANAYEGTWQGRDGRDILLSKVPELIAAGRLPAAAEVAVLVAKQAEDAALAAEAERQRGEAAARAASDRRAAEEVKRQQEIADRARLAAERLELAQALRDMLARLGPMGEHHLTNYEADALARAAERISPSLPLD